MMGDLSRRRFLTTAAPAVALAGTPTAAIASAPASEKDPDLIAAAGWFAHEHAIALGLKEKHGAAREAYAAIEPPIPPDLIVRGDDPCGPGFGERSIDVSSGGHRIHGPRLATVCETTRRLEGVDRRTVLGRYFVKKLKVAAEYEAAVAKAKTETQIGEAETASFLGERAAFKAFEALFAIPARTAEGLRLKADSLSAIVGTLDRHRGYERFGLTLAEDASRVLSRQGTLT